MVSIHKSSWINIWVSTFDSFIYQFNALPTSPQLLAKFFKVFIYLYIFQQNSVFAIFKKWRSTLHFYSTLLFSDHLRDLQADTRLNEAIIELVKSLAMDFGHFEKFSEAILAKVKRFWTKDRQSMGAAELWRVH
jgi:hypothetical protein